MSTPDSSLRPLLAAMAGVALFSAMDAALKGAALAIGAFSAYFLRCALGTLLVAPVWYWRERRRIPGPVMQIHLIRGVVVAGMGLTFFFSLVRLPLAQAIAISFVAPLISLWLATLILGERIQPRAILAALLGFAGVVVIVGGKILAESLDDEAMIGLAAILVSALLYALSLVLQRKQALVAGPAEVSMMQSAVAGCALLFAAPFFFTVPGQRQWLEVSVGAALAVMAGMLLGWAYARAEAQVLVPIEYSGFIWAALFGWLYFGERVTAPTVAGTVLIVAGCWMATRRRPEQTAL